MYAVLITIAVLILLRLLFERKARARPFETIGATIQSELSAWLVAMAALVGIFILVFFLTLVFGPIPPVHEW